MDLWGCRLDLVVARAGQQGIRLILALTNYWTFLGGMQARRWLCCWWSLLRCLRCWHAPVALSFTYHFWLACPPPLPPHKQWYADQILGAGQPRELFYTDPLIRDAYKNFVAMLVTRVNTYTGVRYNESATVLAWELANEPRTSDNWDSTQGLAPGQAVREWVAEMAAYLKSLDSLHMVATGRQGLGFERCNKLHQL